MWRTRTRLALLWMAIVATVALCLPGCAALEGWAHSPVSNGDPIVFTDPVTGTEVELTIPEGDVLEPVEVELPDGSVIIVQPPEVGPRTKGGAFLTLVGGVIGALTGNPPALMALLAMGRGALNTRRRRWLDKHGDPHGYEQPEAVPV